jgi:hypothetical protein
MQSDKTIKQITYLLKLFVKQKFEDTKEIIRSRKSKTEISVCLSVNMIDSSPR